MEENNSSQQEGAAIKVIQDINSGACDPLLLDKATRQQCIEVLIAEGYSHPQLAQLLKRSEKTISRDTQEIRRKNALTPSMEFAQETIGELVLRARQHASSLVRLARSKDSSTSEKAQSEFLAWRVFRDLVDKLQTLGFLPLKPQEVTGDIYHHVLEKDDDSLEGVKKMISEVELVAKETGTFNQDLSDEISQLNAQIEKAEVTLKVKNLSKKQQSKQMNQEVKNGQ